MSHLPHVMDYKAKLNTLGITCPKQCSEIADLAYVNAILRSHFKASPNLGLTQDEEEAIWAQLDRWNKVSPINASLIFQTAKQRISSIRISLITKGTPPLAFTTVVVVEGQEGVDAAANDEFETLVAYLQKELGTGHE